MHLNFEVEAWIAAPAAMEDSFDLYPYLRAFLLILVSSGQS